jgi:hypothetical protein
MPSGLELGLRAARLDLVGLRPGGAWPFVRWQDRGRPIRSPNGLSDVARIGLRYYGANATGVAIQHEANQHGLTQRGITVNRHSGLLT